MEPLPVLHNRPPPKVYGFSSADCSRGGIDAPDAKSAPSSIRHTSVNRENFGEFLSGSHRCCSTVSGNSLPPTDLLHCNTTRAWREENLRHGEATPPAIWHTTSETTLEGADAGTGSDRWRLRPERRGVATTYPGTAGERSRTDRPLSATPGIAGTRRAQCLEDMLRNIAEYQNASAPFRPFWRRLALHDIVAFKREFLIPERQAFEAAVARSQARRAA